MESGSAMRLPVNVSTTSFWQCQEHENLLNKKSHHLTEDYDIAIIGGGYAGVSTAYHILKAQSTLKVVLLEARDSCSGATSRNGGHLRPDYVRAAARSCDRYGACAAAEVVKFEVDHIQAIKSLIKEEAINCDFEEGRSFEILMTEEYVSTTAEKYEMLKSLPDFKSFMPEVDFYVGSDAPDRTGVVHAKGYLSTPTANLSPYKLIIALLNRALQKGLILKTQTPVLSIKKNELNPGSESARSYWLESLNGKICAKKVVFATNAYTSALLPEYVDAIIPCKGSASHISRSDGQILPRLPVNSYAIREEGPYSSGTNYMIQRADNTLILGGAHHTYKHDLSSWYNNVDDGVLIDSATSHFKGYMQQRFIGWHDSQAEVDRIWTGIMGYSADSLPHVGQVPEREDMFILAGFNGHGMPVAYLSAKGIAEMICQDKTYEETNLPPLYRTSRERLRPKFNDILQVNPVQVSNAVQTVSDL